MSEQGTEYDRIIDALNELGETAGDVGHKLIELDCRGWREEGAACPVYHYLTLVKGIERIERVVVDQVWIGDEELDPGQEPEQRVPLPPSVAQFVLAFDQGEWPQLERH